MGNCSEVLPFNAGYAKALGVGTIKGDGVGSGKGAAWLMT